MQPPRSPSHNQAMPKKRPPGVRAKGRSGGGGWTTGLQITERFFFFFLLPTKRNKGRRRRRRSRSKRRRSKREREREYLNRAKNGDPTGSTQWYSVLRATCSVMVRIAILVGLSEQHIGLCAPCSVFFFTAVAVWPIGTDYYRSMEYMHAWRYTFLLGSNRPSATLTHSLFFPLLSIMPLSGPSVPLTPTHSSPDCSGASARHKARYHCYVPQRPRSDKSYPRPPLPFKADADAPAANHHPPFPLPCLFLLCLS